MLKSNVTLEDDNFVLTFKAKGGKAVRKECDAAKLVRAIGILRSVPGKRMFQYRDNSGTVRTVSTTTVNAFLREIAGIKISLKDFRTLMASAVVLESLSRITPAASERGRKKQVLDAVRAAADDSGRFELIAGERRWRAARRAGSATAVATLRRMRLGLRLGHGHGQGRRG